MRSLLMRLPALGLLALAAPAWADAPKPWEMSTQAPATPIMDEITGLHDYLLVVITLIAGLVLGLLIYVMWRFSERKNPTPSRQTHNTMIEVLWTAIPIVILVTIAVPSFRLLYNEDVIPKADLTLKATGHQWYWSYEYPDQGDLSFDALIIPTSDLKPGQKRLLETDNHVVVPVNKTVVVQVTSTDVIHSWAVPAFGVKVDAVPGRLNETWFKVEREGMYYGQCSELCGVNHGFMPITIEAVSQDKFDAWARAKQSAASGEGPAQSVAQAAPTR